VGAPICRAGLRQAARRFSAGRIIQTVLGGAYYNGEGVPQDYVLAHMWFNLAASSSGPLSHIAAYNREVVESKMTPAQIAEAQKLAREWKPK
jgi:uncharacterized protein